MAQVIPVEEGSPAQVKRRRVCVCAHRPLVCLAIVSVVCVLAIVLAVWQPWKGKYAPDQPAQLLVPSVFPNSTTVYLGNGCFWERQYAYTNLELDCTFSPASTTAACVPFRRSLENITSKAGYAGGVKSGLACYDTYKDMGHTEVTSVELEQGEELQQFSALLVDYFSSFNAFGNGMSRPDPGDKGSAYRSLLAFPGGIKSPWFKLVQQHNIHEMQLKEGRGGEEDEFNTVWIMDSQTMLHVRAEQYHQFHSNFFGPQYPDSYIYDLWLFLVHRNAIPPTGCSEEKHW